MASLFSPEDTQNTQDHVRKLFSEMSETFNQELIASLVAAPEKLKEYMQPDIELSGQRLIEASSLLESVLTKIEMFAAEDVEDPSTPFDKWKAAEEHRYNDKLDMARMEDEGGAFDDPLQNKNINKEVKAAYEAWKSQAKLHYARHREAKRLTKTPEFMALKSELEKMCAACVRQANNNGR